MAIDQRKRLGKLIRKAAKRRQQLAEKQLATGNILNWPKAQQREAASKAPIHECLVPEMLFEYGLGTVLFSRKLGGQWVAVSGFLLDVQCLGVKNAFFSILPIWEYHSLVEKTERSGGPHRTETPAYTRKLIEDTLRYAASLGFAPHPDYRGASTILGDVDGLESREVFTFGHKGKPFYVSGPHETPEDIRRNLAVLESSVGRGNFEFLIRA